MGTSEIKVGAFALGGAAVLAGIITFMGVFDFSGKGYELHIHYPQVSGLMTGHVVRFAGVQVGTVKKIYVYPDKIEVIAEIQEGIRIPQGADFSVAADGIMGEKYVNITPPAVATGELLEEGATVKGEPGAGMDEFFAQGGALMARLDRIATSFEKVFGDADVQYAMKDGFKNLRDITQNMNEFTKVLAELAANSRGDLAGMVKQMNELTLHMNNSAKQIERLLVNVNADGETGSNIAAIAGNMAETTQRLAGIAGLLEQMAKDPVVQDSLKETIVNVKETSAKANQLLGTFTNAEFSLDVGHNTRGSDWRGNLGVTLRPSDRSFFHIGGYDIGDSNKFDFTAGRRFGRAGLSAGAMQGEFGVGASYDLGPYFRLYTQLYDFDDARWRLGGELRVTDNVAVYGESMDLRGNSTDTYVGVRSYF